MIKNKNEKYLRSYSKKLKVNKLNDEKIEFFYDNKFKLVASKAGIIKCLRNLILNHKDINHDDILTHILSNNILPIEENIIFRCILLNLIEPPKNIITRRDTYFISNDSKIPLIGTHYFGLIDRGTNLIQVRPVTGCPLNCIYCSVDEGPFSRTNFVDYYVDWKYLVHEFDKLVDFKGRHNIEAHIDGQGEPLLYPDIVKLVSSLRNIDGVEVISMQTNGVLLTYDLIDQLHKAGLDRINISINSLSNSKAAMIAGLSSYKVDKIIKVVTYANSLGIHVLIAPVWISGLNDKDILEIIDFAKNNLKRIKNWPILGIQNYEYYNRGRNPKGFKSIAFNDFYKRLAKLEKTKNIKPLILSLKDFSMHKRRMLPYVYRKKQIISTKLVLPGRHLNEFIGVTNERSIEVFNTRNKRVSLGKAVKVMIVRNKHNIYSGIIL
ncbi:MAG: radical SAM protein [Candidatus Asgardarchaeia archaeon]